jgi:hypothetical protein
VDAKMRSKETKPLLNLEKASKDEIIKQKAVVEPVQR